MKTVLACVGAFGLLVLAGPAQQLAGTTRSATTIPAWLNLPEGGEIASIERSGSGGTITYYLGDDAEGQLSAMKSRLASDGFVVEESVSAVDTFMGVTNFAVARRPVAGQELRMVLIDTPTGHLLSVSFDQDVPKVASVL